jgi:hypothetical protein
MLEMVLFIYNIHHLLIEVKVCLVGKVVVVLMLIMIIKIILKKLNKKFLKIIKIQGRYFNLKLKKLLIKSFIVI